VSEIIDISAGLWWKFSAYEVREGYIRPSPGATLLPYDPWKEYRRAPAKEKSQVIRPYQPLLGLADKLVIIATENGADLAAESQVKVVEWCNRYGLLGILPHQAQMVNLVPRWEPLSFNPTGPLVPSQKYFARTNTGWYGSGRQILGGTEAQPIENDLTQKGLVVPEEYRPKNLPSAGVLSQELRSTEVKWQSLTDAWAPYFPDVALEERETYQYPMPLSVPFWREYAESVFALWNAAMAFRNTVNWLQISKPLGEMTDQDRFWIYEGVHNLHALLGSVVPSLKLGNDGVYHQQWASKSLLASFAMMVLLDVTEHRRILTCPVCGRVFVTEAWQGFYCSDTCRHTAQKRRQRDRQRTRENGNLKPPGLRGRKRISSKPKHISHRNQA
jgi:predicted nucleic acid-binding Zn ribbon protein